MAASSCDYDKTDAYRPSLLQGGDNFAIMSLLPEPLSRKRPLRFALLIVVLLCGLSGVAVAQSPPSDPDQPNPYPERPRLPELPKKPLARRNIWVNEHQFTAEERRLLEPSTQDHEDAALFLRLPDTGLVRLYPWARRRRVVSIDDLNDRRTPDFSAHACLYSFSKEKHGNGLHGFVDPRLGWAELKLGDGRFFAGFTGESLGVFVALGDVPLETVTPQTDGVTGLTNIIPPADYLEASSLSRRNRAGFQMDKFSYGSSLPVSANTTYVLRSTSNKRADLLVTFRVMRVESDGNVTILWRKLKSYPKPSWKRRDD